MLILDLATTQTDFFFISTQQLHTEPGTLYNRTG